MKKNGYLLTELIVVLALAAIVSTMAAPVAVHRRRNQYAVDTTVSELVTEMRCLRTRSIRSREIICTPERICTYNGSPYSS